MFSCHVESRQSTEQSQLENIVGKGIEDLADRPTTCHDRVLNELFHLFTETTLQRIKCRSRDALYASFIVHQTSEDTLRSYMVEVEC